MKKLKIGIIVFVILTILFTVAAIGLGVKYRYFGTMNIRADAGGGGPVGLPILLAMSTTGLLHIWSAFFAAVNACIAIALCIIRKIKYKAK